MAKEVIFLVEEAPEGGYTVRALGYPIFTEADTWDALKHAIRDAVQSHLTKRTDHSVSVRQSSHSYRRNRVRNPT